eukprot:1729707-Rhodomonas_salina.1
MSAEAIAGGGAVAAGGLVATLQSIGAVGFSSGAMMGMAGGGAATAAAAAGVATAGRKEQGTEDSEIQHCSGEVVGDSETRKGGGNEEEGEAEKVKTTGSAQ